jgi:putative tryptophan/tyrosine transport system substrate-binding protein
VQAGLEQQGHGMKRRDLLVLLGGATIARPYAATAQQPERVRRIGLLMNLPPDDPEGHARVGAFLQGLQELGWAIGRNLRIDYRYAADIGSLPKSAAELVALNPEVILAHANPSVTALQQATRTKPIVFVAVSEPVVTGIVESLSRPGGNATGFATADFGTSAKWLELLKELAPQLKRVAVLQDPSQGGAGTPQFAAIQAVAGSFGVELTSLSVRNAGDAEHAIAAFAREPNGGLIATRSTGPIVHRDLIAALAARYKLPAVYPFRLFVTGGGLMSYGPDIVDQCRRAAGYVDRILRNEKPADLPIQQPTKFELVINLKTAKTLGIEVPATLLARADEVLE